jgi:hypothetical protein
VTVADQAIIDRISRLLHLAEHSDHPGERSASLTLAGRLMGRHGLTRSDVGEWDPRTGHAATRPTPPQVQSFWELHGVNVQDVPDPTDPTDPTDTGNVVYPHVDIPVHPVRAHVQYGPVEEVAEYARRRRITKFVANHAANDPDLALLAQRWLREYDGDFRFVLDVRASWMRRRSMTDPQVAGILNCMLKASSSEG